MRSFFANGVAFLKAKLLGHASVDITITRGGESLGTYPAVLARSEFDDVDPSGRRVTVQIVDFLVSGAAAYRPQKGDRIQCGSSVYVVRPYGREVWRYDDPYQELARIHAQLESQ